MDGPPNRRRFLRRAAAGAALGTAGCLQGNFGLQPTDSPTGGTPAGPVGLETVATGFTAPLAMAAAPDAGRLYVADQAGQVRVVDADGLREEPFLDLSGTVEFGGEKGLLGFALHPGFAENRRCFVRYSAPPRAGTPSNYSHTFVLAEFRATDDGLSARREGERTVLEIPQPQSNHNAGDVAFGPDGHLYVTVGDGGAGGDQGTGHVADWYDAVGGGNGQDVTENLLGSVLRIDVGAAAGSPTGGGATPTDDGAPYAVPEDNPLVDGEGLDEHYAWGLRNPWRLSFDGEDLLVADVGQNRYEEVNLVEKGGNYGWNVREATHCYSASDCPEETDDGEPLLDPVVEYPHGGAAVSGISVIGGYVYRGESLSGLEGTYVFGDYAADGRLFAADPRDGEGLWPTRVLEVAEGDRSKLGRLLSFGRDGDDELYVLGTGDGGGGVHRLVPG